MRAVRRAGVPLAAIETSEPAGAFAVVVKAMGNKAETCPILTWNLMSGLVAGNEIAKGIVDLLNEGQEGALITGRPDEMLRKVRKTPSGSMVVMFGSEKVVEDINVRQGVWNLRDEFKADSRTLVMIMTVGTKLTADIKDDVVVVGHDLPNEEWLAKKATTIAVEAGVAAPNEEAVKAATDATLGLSEFAAEQVLAMSLLKEGYSVRDLWDRKRSSIEQTAGLSVWKGQDRFEAIGGSENVKSFFKRLVAGKRRPRCVVFIDEIEKAMSGQNDSSGTNQEMLGTMLTWMQDKNATGSIFVGTSGGGKSAVAKAIGNEAGIPTIAFDLSAMKGSLVGESGARLRSALATVEAIGQGQVLVIATCNSLTSLPPELRRRFTLGTFFFDLPSADERKSIWDIYVSKYKLEGQAMPDDTSWTGAEIKQACDIADRLGCTLVEAAAFVVPVAKSAAEVIETLRKGANNRFLSASYAGVYKYEQQAQAMPLQGRRVLTE